MANSKKKNVKGKTGSTASMVIFIVLALLAAALMFAYFASGGEEANPGTFPVDFHFYSSDSGEWTVETRAIATGGEQQILTDVINQLYAGPLTAGLQPAIPAEVSIEGVKHYENDNYVEIQFSENYNDITSELDIICRGSITLTLTGLGFVDNVHYYVGDEELLTSSGKPIGDMNEENTVASPALEPDNTTTTVLILYFADEQAMGLVAEERSVEINPNSAKEQYIVQQLIEGPESESLYATIPSGTKLLSAMTDSSQGICYVDFSYEFIRQFSGGSAAETMFVYSLVNSLTEETSVKKVQILFDGAKLTDSTTFNMDLSVPIERDEEYILSDEG